MIIFEKKRKKKTEDENYVPKAFKKDEKKGKKGQKEKKEKKDKKKDRKLDFNNCNISNNYISNSFREIQHINGKY